MMNELDDLMDEFIHTQTHASATLTHSLAYTLTHTHTER